MRGQPQDKLPAGHRLRRGGQGDTGQPSEDIQTAGIRVRAHRQCGQGKVLTGVTATPMILGAMILGIDMRR